MLKVEPVGEGDAPLWRITWSQHGGPAQTAEFKGVVIANGTLAEPNMPRFEGQFDGELLHTSAYKNAELFKGKRVLVVGAGNSGCDIAVDAVHYARSVDLSVRRGYYFVPKYVFGKPADTLGGKFKMPPWLKQKVDSTVLQWFTGDPVRFGLPKPDYKMYESHPVVNSLVLHHMGHGDIHVKPDIARFEGHTVHFKDGRSQDYDLVLCATGYKLHYPFIDHSLLNWQGMAPQLYLNILSPRFDNLAVMGMIEASGMGWQGRYEQAELVARFFKAQSEGSPRAEALRQAKAGPPPDLSGGYQVPASSNAWRTTCTRTPTAMRCAPPARWPDAPSKGLTMLPVDEIRLNFNPASLVVLNGVLAFLMFGIALDTRVDDFKRVLRMPGGHCGGHCGAVHRAARHHLCAHAAAAARAQHCAGHDPGGLLPAGQCEQHPDPPRQGQCGARVSMTAVSNAIAIVAMPLNFAFWGGMHPTASALLRNHRARPAGDGGPHRAHHRPAVCAGHLWCAEPLSRTGRRSSRNRCASSAFSALIGFIIGAIAGNWRYFLDYVGLVLLAVVLHDALAFGTGYAVARLGGLARLRPARFVD